MVEWKELKEVFDTRNGYTPSTSNETFWEGGNIPWFKMEDLRDNGGILNDSYLHITEKAIKGKGLFKANSILLATSATIGEHALIEVEHLSNQRFTNFYPKKEYEQIINMRYAYYYMFIIDEWCKQHVNQGGFASVDMSGLYKHPFPIPSISEQERIVDILDTFTSAIDNLKQQIAQRRKQYEYYRDQLLDLEGKEGVEMKTLGESCLIRTGSKPAEILDKGRYCYINAGTTESGYVNESNCDCDVVTTPSRGQGGIGFVGYQRNDFWLGPLCYQIRPNKKENFKSKYLFYYLSSHSEEILKYKSEGGTPAVNAVDLKKIQIHLPPLQEQQRIVSILDTFEASIQNLEAQLSQREKQYEYYRNKLLTFE